MGGDKVDELSVRRLMRHVVEHLQQFRNLAQT